MNEQNSTQTTTQSLNAMAALLQEELRAAEKAVRVRYGHLDIVPGSMKHHVDGYYAGKRVCKVKCACGAVVDRATSDLHTFKGCANCIKVVRRTNKAKKGGGLAGLQAQIAALEAKLAAQAASGTAADTAADTPAETDAGDTGAGDTGAGDTEADVQARADALLAAAKGDEPDGDPANGEKDTGDAQ